MTFPKNAVPDSSRPTLAWMLARPERIIGFGLGSGLIHPAPGTWGTLMGWLLWWLFVGRLPGGWVFAVLVVAFAGGCWVAQRCSDDLGIADFGGINWDEIVAIWLVLWLLPSTFWMQAAGVVLFRVFDILKPAPVSWLDRNCKGGFGIMIDDIAAALYAVLVAWLLIRWGVLP